MKILGKAFGLKEQSQDYDVDEDVEKRKDENIRDEYLDDRF